jgi:O-succinylbenzoate synthase
VPRVAPEPVHRAAVAAAPDRAAWWRDRHDRVAALLDAATGAGRVSTG